MHLSGKAFKFGNDVNTDYIISGKYKFKTLDMEELAKYVMEDLDPDFYQKISEGDMIVAGSNFGCGSSREQAPLAIKYAKISCVLASSFARIFYRNAINTGLPVLECDTSQIEEGDVLEVFLKEGVVLNKTKGRKIPIKPLPQIMIKILADGGLTNHFRKHGNFNLA
jgi:3-isopropylmalate/(R)-2-methylmalate dehydratase small subunit